MLRRFQLSSSSSNLKFLRPASTKELESKFESLQSTVSKQQVALAGLAKKLLASKKTESSTPVVANNENFESLQKEVEEFSSSLSNIQQTVNSLESRVKFMESEMKKNQNNISPSNNNNNNISPRLLTELVSRISAIESKQAILKVAQLKQQQSSTNHNTNKNQDQQQQVLVSMEPGIDGTPRMMTTQVKVFHPTAMAPDIRNLMESAGPVVSCLRKPGGGGGGGNNRNNNHKSNYSTNSSNFEGPCFVVTFQNTVDATRAVENITGIMIKGVTVRVEPYVLPEQMLAVPASTKSSSSDGEDEEEFHGTTGQKKDEGFVNDEDYF